MSKVFVGSLSWNTTTPALVDRFAEFGTIEDARILTDRETGRSRGYGFITFSTEEAAQNAIAQANESEFDGRVIKVSWPVVRDASEEGASGFKQNDNWRNRNAEGGGRSYNSGGYRGRGGNGASRGGRGGFNSGYQSNRGGNYRSGGGQGYDNQNGQQQQYYNNNSSYQNQGEDAAFEQ